MFVGRVKDKESAAPSTLDSRDFFFSMPMQNCPFKIMINPHLAGLGSLASPSSQWAIAWGVPSQR